MKKLMVVLLLFCGCSHYTIVEDHYGPKTWYKAHILSHSISEYKIYKSNERSIRIKDNIGNEIDFIRSGDDESTTVIAKGLIGGQYSNSNIMTMMNKARLLIKDYMEK